MTLLPLRLSGFNSATAAHFSCHRWRFKGGSCKSRQTNSTINFTFLLLKGSMNVATRATRLACDLTSAPLALFRGCTHAAEPQTNTNTLIHLNTAAWPPSDPAKATAVHQCRDVHTHNAPRSVGLSNCATGQVHASLPTAFPTDPLIRVKADHTGWEVQLEKTGCWPSGRKQLNGGSFWDCGIRFWSAWFLMSCHFGLWPKVATFNNKKNPKSFLNACVVMLDFFFFFF